MRSTSNRPSRSAQQITHSNLLADATLDGVGLGGRAVASCSTGSCCCSGDGCLCSSSALLVTDFCTVSHNRFCGKASRRSDGRRLARRKSNASRSSSATSIGYFLVRMWRQIEVPRLYSCSWRCASSTHLLRRKKRPQPPSRSHTTRTYRTTHPSARSIIGTTIRQTGTRHPVAHCNYRIL